MSEKDYYKVLGVDKSADTAQIKKAFRSLAMKYHPDRASEADKKSAEERFKEISEAYYVLSDPEKRREYDMFRDSGRAYSGGFQGATGFDFEEILRHFRAAQGGRASSRSRGSARYAGFDDIFGEIFSGGFSSGPRSGYTYRSNTQGPSAGASDPNIRATLKVPAEICRRGGEVNFALDKKKNIAVKIPPGTKNKQKMRLKDQGRICQCCGKPGDLILTISYA